jgi:hypothetical protein
MAARGNGAAMTGFVVFAGLLLLVIGMVNIFQGFVALFADERLVLTRNNLVVVNVTAWGWLLVISGLLMLAVGAGLLSGATWARITAIVLVGLHAVTQIAWLGAYPVWSLLMIALDTVVLFALTARWADVRDRLEVGEPPWSAQNAVDLAAAERRTPPLV